VPSHVAVAPAGGAAHGEHDAPQLAVDVLLWQTPEQACVPAGQAQELAWQVWPPVQVTPQPPQLAGSLVTSTHAPPHAVYPLLQAWSHAPPVHTACAWATVVVHAFPHVWQLVPLELVSMHVPLQSVGVDGGHVCVHE
jgi:hypothetical protein